jgi:hypothetical protein
VPERNETMDKSILEKITSKPTFDNTKEFAEYWKSELTSCNKHIQKFNDTILTNISTTGFLSLDERMKIIQYQMTNAHIKNHLTKYIDILDAIQAAYPKEGFLFSTRDTSSLSMVGSIVQDLHSISITSKGSIAEIKLSIEWDPVPTNPTNKLHIQISKRVGLMKVQLDWKGTTAEVPCMRTLTMKNCGGVNKKKPPEPAAVVGAIKNIIKTIDEQEKLYEKGNT